MVLDSQQLVVISIVVKNSFNVRDMFAQSYFALPLNHNTLHHFFSGHFIISPVWVFKREL